MKINKSSYEKKYRKCLKKVTIERLNTLLSSNEEHLENCNMEDQKIITIEIEQIKKEIEERKAGKQQTLGE